VRFERKHGWTLVGVAVWNVVTWTRFIKALVDTTEDRPTGYYVAHSVLIAVNLVIAVVLGRWGWQALRSTGGSANAEDPGTRTSRGPQQLQDR
jgi:hypothetical protein